MKSVAPALARKASHASFRRCRTDPLKSFHITYIVIAPALLAGFANGRQTAA
jgi:hypothetical protein